MKIIQDTKNEVLGRREIIAEIEETKIPSKAEVRKKLAALAQAKAETLVIEKLDTRYGSSKIIIKANSYVDEATMKKVESAYFMKRNFKEVKAEETPAKEETAPAEEKKE